MTQEYVDNLKKLIEKRNRQVVAAKKEFNQISKEIRKVESRCDHLLPNGKSADNGVMFMGFCTICNGSLR